tara:strand:- start:268 stop:468 length:201 start_codon:yes stop_codon:yes gene_type:complete
MKYPRQLEIDFNKPRDATPEEVQEWYETELKPQGDSAMKMVVYATIIQALSLGFMGLCMYIIGLLT